jgi:excinuclease UvrABC nuclease subunit
MWVTERLAADHATYVGPFRSRDAADHALAVLSRVFGLRTCPGRLAPSPDATPCLSGQVGACTAPCAARIDEVGYGTQVRRLLAFLDGADDGPLAALAARRDALAADMRFESAARAQRDVELLDRLRRRQRALGWVVGRQNFVVLLPTTGEDAAHLYAVLGGRLALETRVTTVTDVDAAARVVHDRWAEHQDRRPAREDVDGTTIVAAWLRDRRADEGIILPLDGPEAVFERLDELTVTMSELRIGPALPAIDDLR